MGKNCQEHKILLQKAIQNEIQPVRGNGRDNEDHPVTGNGRENVFVNPFRSPRKEERTKIIRLVGAVTETKFRWFLKIAMGQFREIMESREINTNV